MKLTTAHWPLLAALGCLLLGGWVHGTWSGRWRPQDALVEALARVERVPMTRRRLAGDGAEDGRDRICPGPRQELLDANLYPHPQQGVAASDLDVRPGGIHVGTHAGNLLSGAGYEMARHPVPWSLEKTAAAEQLLDRPISQARQPERANAALLGLERAWPMAGAAAAALETQGEPFLYKMYVSYEATTADTHLGKEFFRDFLPSLQQALFPSDK